MVRATRVRRRRMRRAIGRSVIAACLVAGTLLAVEVTGAAVPADGPSPAVRFEASPARAAIPAASDQATDVGIWVVEGSLAASAAGDPTVGDGRESSRIARVVVLGKDHDVTTNAVRVGQLLSAMGIELDANDRVSPPPRTPLRPTQRTEITVIDVTFGTRTTTRTIPYQVETEYTTKLPAGEVKVIRGGSNGKARVTLRQVFEDGKLVSEKTIATKVLIAPISRLRRVGTFTHDPADGRTETGQASWYEHAGLTAASPWLAMGTVVKVTNLANGKTVSVVINDRGPFGGGIIDLSDSAFARIASLQEGIITVRLEW